MFMKELRLYVEFLKGEIRESVKPLDEKQRKFIETFRENLTAGIGYYRALLLRTEERWAGMWRGVQEELSAFENELKGLFAGDSETAVAVTR